jgi:hypothetical protein
MATVFITSTAKNTKGEPYATVNYKRVLRAAQSSLSSDHVAVNNPEKADLILFVDAHSRFYLDILKHPLYVERPDDCFINDGRDNTLPLLPGIYMDLPFPFNGMPIYCYGFYIRVFDNSMLDSYVPHSKCEYLFSFVGKSANYPPVRNKIINLLTRQANRATI